VIKSNKTDLFQRPNDSYTTDKLQLGIGQKVKVVGELAANGKDYYYVYTYPEVDQFRNNGYSTKADYRKQKWMFVEKGKVKSTLVTANQLVEIGYKNATTAMVNALNKTLFEFSITTPERIRQFLAQCFVETGQATLGGPFLTEISWVFPIVQSYEEWYFDTKTDYGYKYRGGGYIHLTWNGINPKDGKLYDTYQQFSNYIGDPNVVSQGADYLASTPELSWRSAGWFWSPEYKNVNSVITKNDCNLAEGKLLVETVTRKVQGWNSALTERKAAYEEAWRVIK